MNADAVFEGGGVKGIGLVGAVCCLEEKGYRWQRLAGTSAGAILAALLASGYSGRELKKILMNIDYTKFLSRDKIQSLPLIGKPLGIFTEKGMYSGDNIEDWISNLLSAKGKTKFKDVSTQKKSRLKIIAADITNKDILVLPDDLGRYGIDPMEFEIARAVRMSIGIPFYFKPVVIKDKNKSIYIVDGSVLSNFPVWIFDSEGTPKWPTFGFKLINPSSRTAQDKKGVFSFLFDIIDTMIEEDEIRYIRDKDFIRTIPIPALGIKSIDFGITKGKSIELFNSGYMSAERFVNFWDFNKYINNYRSESIVPRKERLWQ